MLSGWLSTSSSWLYAPRRGHVDRSTRICECGHVLQATLVVVRRALIQMISLSGSYPCTIVRLSTDSILHPSTPVALATTTLGWATTADAPLCPTTPPPCLRRPEAKAQTRTKFQPQHRPQPHTTTQTTKHEHNYEQRGNETLVAGAGPSIVVDARIIFMAFASLLLYRRLERGKHRCGLRALRRSRDCGLRALRLRHPLWRRCWWKRNCCPWWRPYGCWGDGRSWRWRR